MTDHFLDTPNKCNWCPGCGNFGIWAGFKMAAEKAGWDNTNTAITAGIGCHGHVVNFLKINAFETLHGRSIPVACGIKLANPRLNVFVFTGDGDCLSEGGNHFIHAARRNHDITVILHDNAIYGLTTGQTSPRSPQGYKSKSTPEGNINEPVHPLRLAIISGATFAARVYSSEAADLAEMMIRANEHRGFSIIQVLQPCVTFNKLYTHEFYQKNIYKIPDDHDVNDKQAALRLTYEWGEGRIPVGLFYETQELTIEEKIPTAGQKPVVEQPVKVRDIDGIMDKYM